MRALRVSTTGGTEVAKRIGFVVERIVPDVRVGAEYVRGSQVQYHGNGIALCRARRLE
jgi:hypothetical protein